MVATFVSSSSRYVDVAEARLALSVLASLSREVRPDSSISVVLQQARNEIMSLLESELAAGGIGSRVAA